MVLWPFQIVKETQALEFSIIRPMYKGKDVLIERNLVVKQSSGRDNKTKIHAGLPRRKLSNLHLK